VVGVVRHLDIQHRLRAAERVLDDLADRQDSYRAELGQYIDPAGSTDPRNPWEVALRPPRFGGRDARAPDFRFEVLAGPPGTAPTESKDSWYEFRGRADLDGDGRWMTIVRTSYSPELRVGCPVLETPCPLGLGWE